MCSLQILEIHGQFIKKWESYDAFKFDISNVCFHVSQLGDFFSSSAVKIFIITQENLHDLQTDSDHDEDETAEI